MDVSEIRPDAIIGSKYWINTRGNAASRHAEDIGQ